ncbi:Hsp20/alpha crystallin family protein [bacterium]|nr:Hsp20/alpha crystallin family protein [bacterium]
MSDFKEWTFKDLLGPLDEEVDFFFSSFFGSSYPAVYRKELCWKPPTDVYETDTDFVVILELAQMKSEEVSITYERGVLFIRGVRKAVPPKEPRRYQKMEINYGPFERRIAVSEDVDIENLAAHYEDGFLEIKLPKRHDAFGIAIDIEVE